MEMLVSAVVGDLVSRFVSFMTGKYGKQMSVEEKLERLNRVLLRVHTIIEEAKGRQITNQGMFLQLKMLVEVMYRGYYVLDTFKCEALEGKVEDEVSYSFALSSFNPAKRLCRAAGTTKSIVFGSEGTNKLQNVLGSLETTIGDIKEFVVLLSSCPRIIHQPYSTYLFMDKCMFGRHIEKEQIINFLLHPDTPDTPNLSVLPITGPHRVGKKTLVHHVCIDERVRDHFSLIVFFDGDDLKNGKVTTVGECGEVKNHKYISQKYLFVIEFTSGVDVAAWKKFHSSIYSLASGSKIIIISRTDEIVSWGTTRPIRLKALSQEEYWYFFKALAFGSMDSDEHPKLAFLGMQIAAELKGSFLGANILGELLRANPNARFWRCIFLSIREMIQKHFFLFGEHPEDLLDKNRPIDMDKVAYMSAPDYLVYDLKDAGPAQSELPKLTSQELLLGNAVPSEEKFDVLMWKSRIPPYRNYIATFVKEKPQRVVNKKKHLQQRLICQRQSSSHPV